MPGVRHRPHSLGKQPNHHFVRGECAGADDRPGDAWTPARSPRARSGHSLTAVGPHMLLVGGEATSHIEYPLSERFAVQGVQLGHGSLEPRLRGQSDQFSPHIPSQD